jgi:hypothetical protein
MPPLMTIDAFFAGNPVSRRLFDALQTCVLTTGAVDLRITRSQVAFVHRRPFAWAWMAGRWLGPGHAPLVLTVALRRRDPSPRWKEVVEPAPGRFTHHLELHEDTDIDEEVRSWLVEAWALAA